MGRFAKIEPLITALLNKYPETRDSDSLLYAKTCEVLNPRVNTLAFTEVMANRSRLGLPCAESVRRARQKIQAERPELRATPETMAARTKMESEYRAYALE